MVQDWDIICRVFVKQQIYSICVTAGSIFEHPIQIIAQKLISTSMVHRDFDLPPRWLSWKLNVCFMQIPCESMAFIDPWFDISKHLEPLSRSLPLLLFFCTFKVQLYVLQCRLCDRNDWTGGSAAAKTSECGTVQLGGPQLLKDPSLFSKPLSGL